MTTVVLPFILQFLMKHNLQKMMRRRKETILRTQTHLNNLMGKSLLDQVITSLMERLKQRLRSRPLLTLPRELEVARMPLAIREPRRKHLIWKLPGRCWSWQESFAKSKYNYLT